MKGTIVWGVAAALLAVVGVVCLRIATVERLVADAQQDLATLNYERAEQSLTDAPAAARCSTGSRSTTRWCLKGPTRWPRSRKATSISSS
jgi:hypothetical protein